MVEMLLRYITDVLLWLTAVVVAALGGYFLARYTGVGESIWGNSIDGYGGDAPYRNKEANEWFRKLWPDWWWSCIRNPANNLARRLSAHGRVSDIELNGNMKIVTMEGGSRFFFYYTPYNRIMWKLGYKLWDSTTFIGSEVDGKLAFSVQKGR